MSAEDSSGRPVNLSASGPPATVIDREPAEALDALRAALSEPSVERREAVSAVVARWPRYLDAWARLDVVPGQVAEAGPGVEVPGPARDDRRDRLAPLDRWLAQRGAQRVKGLGRLAVDDGRRRSRRAQVDRTAALSGTHRPVTVPLPLTAGPPRIARC